MLNVAKLDPGSFSKYPEDFVALFFQTVVTDKLSVEHKYVSALLAMPGAAVHPIFDGVADLPLGDLDRGTFMDRRGAILESEPGRRGRVVPRVLLTVTL
jgi:hypothetical protein